MKSGKIDLDRIDRKSVEVCGIRFGEYPDFESAYVGIARWKNGKPLTDQELQDFKAEHENVIYDYFYDAYCDLYGLKEDEYNYL